MQVEREEAVQFLEQKDLLNQTNDLIGKSGVIGEETSRLLMYLIFTSRKREHPLHIISLGSSGIGKTYLQEKVGVSGVQTVVNIVSGSKYEIVSVGNYKIVKGVTVGALGNVVNFVGVLVTGVDMMNNGVPGKTVQIW